ncbi:MAG: type II toxin-antitoxin system VapC family toxin [Elusimicrobia bacterium]|nr:type II toxin-antitoxin system VapC family toxin [Elusimicrobiota bacterium]
MKRAFVDTSAWYAFCRADDPDHEPVAEALERWDGRLVTSNFVFDETVTLAAVRLGHKAACKVGEFLRDRGAVDLVRVTPEDEEEAWSLFAGRKDRGYSYTDCASFAVMKRLRLPLAIAADRHFALAGFVVEPSPAAR